MTCIPEKRKAYSADSGKRCNAFLSLILRMAQVSLHRQEVRRYNPGLRLPWTEVEHAARA